MLYILLLSALFLYPVQGEDVGKLIPVELVHLSRDGDQIIIATDTEAAGSGQTVDAALENLKATAAGIVFLDTADYLLIDESAASEVVALKKHLKASVRVCELAGDLELKEAAVYLAVHGPETKLREYREDADIEKLTVVNGRILLKEN